MRVPRASDPAPAAGGHSEADLVQRCLDGDAAAWDTLARGYWKRVFNIAYKFVAQVDEAEDLTQEIFVKLFRALPTYDRRASFETWLTRVSRNLCIDHYRRRRLHLVSLDAPLDQEPGERSRDLPDPAPLPDELTSRRESASRMETLVQGLPPRYRIVILLRYKEDLAYEEIAEVLRLPLGTVKARLHRAHHLLKRRIEPGQGGDR